MRHIFPLLRSDGKGYRVQFRNPRLQNKNVTASLGTRDEKEARAICHDLSLLCSDPELWQDLTSPRLLAYDRRALEVFFGQEHKEAIARLYSRAVFDKQEIRELEGAVAVALTPKIESLEEDKITFPGPAEGMDWVRRHLKEFSPRKFRAIQKQCRDLEVELKSVLPRMDDLEAENERLRRAQNLHVKVTIQEAYEQWRGGRAQPLAPKTRKEACYAIESFITSLPGTDRCKLAVVRASQINGWLDRLKSKHGHDLSAVTKGKMRRYIGMFMTWCYRQFDLFENPIEKTLPLAGVTKNGEAIVAITDLAEFQEFLSTLERIAPYWHALAATAVLAGPRFSELCWLRIEHINLDQHYIRVATRSDRGQKLHTKTGKERNTPIETTTLLSILRAHVARRKDEQRKPSSTPAEKSSFLFPSTVPENVHKPRTKMPPGVWSDNGVFLDAWRQIAKQGEALTGPRSYWAYGPREWRHCAGTAMGHSGNDSVRISAWLGTSEDMCRRHYVRPSDTGTLWPYKW